MRRDLSVFGVIAARYSPINELNYSTEEKARGEEKENTYATGLGVRG
jgi:hypothetical protein